MLVSVRWVAVQLWMLRWNVAEGGLDSLSIVRLGICGFFEVLERWVSLAGGPLRKGLYRCDSKNVSILNPYWVQKFVNRSKDP